MIWLRQLGVERDEALNQNILELLKIDDEYELRDLITQSPELMIDSQDVNGEYISLRVRLLLFVENLALFQVLLLYYTIQLNKRRKNESEGSLYRMLAMNCELL